MSKITVVVCDLHDGQEQRGETFRYALGSTQYEADLCASCQQALEAQLAELERYLAVSVEPARRTATKTRQRGPRTSSAEATAIREWARREGIEIGDKGRVSDALRARYRAAAAAPALSVIGGNPD